MPLVLPLADILADISQAADFNTSMPDLCLTQLSADLARSTHRKHLLLAPYTARHTAESPGVDLLKAALPG